MDVQAGADGRAGTPPALTEAPRGVAAGRRHHRRARRRAHPRWVDFSVALTALVVSVASLFVARHQAQVMDRQLAASVWPVIKYAFSNTGPDGAPLVTLGLTNSGVGPARIQSFRVTYDGRPMRSADDLGRACCRVDTLPAGAVQGRSSYVVGRVASVGEHFDFLTARFDAAHRGSHATLSDALSRGRVGVRVCYCSVLDDCWVSTGAEREPEPVASCAAEQAAPQYR